ncbi:hypothetical protein [Chryseobacterium shandongense]|uniref:hypothetical protein n=1 Tax=Chryseobacterium shandongense TaxID=1493872 RepID=UPI000F4F84A3|nr:hypothetical protein [Chryseobacterium shandongense]
MRWVYFYLPHDKIVRERGGFIFICSKSGEFAQRGAKFYGVSIDQIVHPDNEVPTEVVVEDKTLIEQVRLINELEEKDKNVIFAMLETMLTKQKFKDFFNKNVAAL